MQPDSQVTSIKGLFEVIDQKIKDVIVSIAEIANDDVKINVGYNKSKHFQECERITKLVDEANVINENYCLVLGKQESLSTLNEFIQIANAMDINIQNTTEIEYYLKEKYLILHSVPTAFPGFKKKSLIEAFDFPQEVDDSINAISQSVKSVLSPNKLSDLTMVVPYWKEDNSDFEFTKEDAEALKVKYSILIDQYQIAEMISLKLLCHGMNNLRKEPYSFANLPEIDYRLMELLEVEYNSNVVDVNVEKVADKYGIGFTTQMKIRVKSKDKA